MTDMCRGCRRRPRHKDEDLCDICSDLRADARDRYREALNDAADVRRGQPRNNEEDDPDGEAG